MVPEVTQFYKWLRRKRPLTTTAVHYTRDLRLFFDWIDKPPEAVTVRDIDRYIDRCQQRGHAIATINRRLFAIRAFYQFLALDRDHPPPNPVLPKRHVIAQGRQLPRDARDDDIKRLFAVIDDARDKAMFLIMLKCGLRVSEIQKLSMGDLYLAPSPGNLPRLWVRGKGGADRVVYLSRSTLIALQAWLAIRPDVPSEAVFLNRSQGRFTTTGIQLRLGHYCHLAGVWITCHQLRHTFGRHMTEARMPVTSIQKLLGHASLRTTQLYMYISDPEVQADYEAAMDQVLERMATEGGAP